MASLLAGLDEAPTTSRRPTIPSSPLSRKRASSPDFFSSSQGGGLSSDGIASDDSFLGTRGGDWRGAPDKRARLDRRPPPPPPLLHKGSSSARAAVKKEDLEEIPVKLEEDVEMGENFGLEPPGSPDWPDDDPEMEPSPPPLNLADTGKKPKKEEVSDDDDDDDEMVFKPKVRSAQQQQAKRSYVNASSISTKSYLPPAPTTSSSKPADNTLRPLPKFNDPDEAAPSTPAWLTLANSLADADSQGPPPSSDMSVPSSPPPEGSLARRTKTQKNAPPTTTIAAFEASDPTTLRMFWLDYYERESRTGDIKSTDLYLIGKVWDREGGNDKRGQWVSCCLEVRGLQRNLFVCPRQTSFGKSWLARRLATHEL